MLLITKVMENTHLISIMLTMELKYMHFVNTCPKMICMTMSSK